MLRISALSAAAALSCEQGPADAGSSRAVADVPRAAAIEPDWIPTVDPVSVATIGAAVDGWVRVRTGREGPQFQRVAALDREHVVAVTDAGLLRRREQQWERLRLDGAEPVDVIAVRTGLLVLARGVGVNAGRLLIVRIDPSWELRLVTAPLIGPDVGPRSLFQVRDREFYVGGDRPALLRIVVPDFLAITVREPRVDRITVLRDETVVAWRDATHLSLHHWGESSDPPIGDVVDVLLDADRSSILVHADGRFERARPGNAGEVIATLILRGRQIAASAMLPDGVPAAALDNGDVEIFRAGNWARAPAAISSRPIAMLSTTPPMVAGIDGELAVIDGSRPESVVPSQTGRWRTALPLLDGTLLLVSTDGVRRITRVGSTPLDARGVDGSPWRNEPADLGGASAVIARAGPGGSAVLAIGRRVFRVHGDGVVDVPGLRADVLSLAMERDGTLVSILADGSVVRARENVWAAAGSLPRDALGGGAVAFVGMDGRVRIASPGRTLSCIREGRLSNCGARIPPGSTIAALHDAVVVHFGPRWELIDGRHREELPPPRWSRDPTSWSGWRGSIAAWADGDVHYFHDGRWTVMSGAGARPTIEGASAGREGTVVVWHRDGRVTLRAR